MIPQLENLDFSTNSKSIHFFKVEAKYYAPYWHYHPELELTFIKKGSGIRYIGDHVEQFYPEDLVLVGENLPHHWVSDPNDKEDKVEAYILQFSKGVLKSIPECKELSSFLIQTDYGFSFRDIDIEKIESKLKIALKEDFVNRFILFIEIIKLLFESKEKVQLSTVSFSKPGNQSKNQKRVSKVQSYIIQNMEHSISLDEVSNKFHMTKPSFCRWFKQSFNESFVNYLNVLRIERACQYLLNTDWNISKIAFEVGFESISNFNRTFLKLKNTSPRNFRK